jgi:hypothetical protein
VTNTRQRGTLLRPGILVAVVLCSTLSGYLLWFHLHYPGEAPSTMPVASLLILMTAAALGADIVRASTRAVLTAALATTLLVVGYAALMSLGIALLVLAMVEIVLLVRQVQGLPATHSIASLALGTSVGAVVSVGFFNWSASLH